MQFNVSTPKTEWCTIGLNLTCKEMIFSNQPGKRLFIHPKSTNKSYKTDESTSCVNINKQLTINFEEKKCPIIPLQPMKY